MSFLSVKGQNQLGKVARVLREKGNDPALKRRVSKVLRDEAKPITVAQRASLAAGLPKRGGAAATISGEAAFGVRVNMARAEVVITDSWRGHSIPKIDQGVLRHPLWGNRDHWYDTSVPRHLLSRPFDDSKRRIQFAILRDLDALAEEIAREV